MAVAVRAFRHLPVTRPVGCNTASGPLVTTERFIESLPLSVLTSVLLHGQVMFK